MAYHSIIQPYICGAARVPPARLGAVPRRVASLPPSITSDKARYVNFTARDVVGLATTAPLAFASALPCCPMYRFRLYSRIRSCGRERMGERAEHAEPGQSPQRQRRDACGHRAGPPARGRGPSCRDQHQCPTQTADHAGAIAKTPTATAGAAPATPQAAGEPVAACVPVPSSIRRAQPHTTSCPALWMQGAPHKGRIPIVLFPPLIPECSHRNLVPASTGARRGSSRRGTKSGGKR